MATTKPPQVLINNLTQTKQSRSRLDGISRILIIAETFFGLNRLKLLNETVSFQKIRVLAACYCFMINVLVVASSTFYQHYTDRGGAVIFVSEFSYLSCCVLGYLTAASLTSCQQHLTSFDRAAGCELRPVRLLHTNIVHHTVFLLFNVVCAAGNIITIADSPFNNRWHLVAVRWIHVLELYFYSHQFHLLVLRMRVINYFMASDDVRAGNMGAPDVFTFRLRSDVDYCEIGFLMGLYETLVKAHRNLIDAIKWQYVIILSSSFLKSMGIANTLALKFLQKDNDTWVGELASTSRRVLFRSYAVGFTLVQFMLCAHETQLAAHVQALRMALASRLYHRHMEKCSRGAARALLALTAERDLSFSLLGMFPVDGALPLSYISLLVSYLIIVLQFEKVMGAGAGAE